MSLEAAACRGYPIEWWFPEQGQSAKKGKEICMGCPCRSECLSEALQTAENDDMGVWGGTTATERQGLRRNTLRRCPGCGATVEYGGKGRIPRCPACAEVRRREQQYEWVAQNRDEVYARKNEARRTAALFDRLRSEVAS